jgi:glycerophosphoryl diester phosphodiesterase
MTIPRRRFEVQGHRGARGLFPENTLEGIAATIALGVDAIELDVAVTADGVAVLFHDVALNPDIVRDAAGWIAPPGALIRHLTAAELAGYDVGRLRPGSRTAARFAEQAAMDGARIPTLAAVLALTARAGVRADIELKTVPHAPEATVSPETMTEIVLATADAAGAAGLIDLRAFDWRIQRHARAIRPDVPLTWLTNRAATEAPLLWWDRALDGSAARTVAAAGGGTWAPEFRDLSREDVAEAHALGLRVAPWTVNAAADIARCLEWGADGVCTDRPDVARAVLQAAGMEMPARAVAVDIASCAAPSP